ncbi:MAG: putative toxin-antitoxin system toxin component, PIN family [Terracidiphilus sp.]
MRVVFDTNTVISALLFASGSLAWLRQHWREGGSIPLVYRATAAELTRVLSYPKFRLSPEDRIELLGDYLPYCETVKLLEKCPVLCRDTNDQPFLDLAQSGNADLLITGDYDLLALTGQTSFLIETPNAYRQRICGAEPAL